MTSWQEVVMKSRYFGVGKRIKRLEDAALIAISRQDFFEYFRLAERIHTLLGGSLK